MRYALFCLLLVGCANSFRLGPTKFVLHDGVEPWDDLPETMMMMQKLEVPEGLWDTEVHLYPGWKELWIQNAQCIYDPTTEKIHIRVAWETTKKSCLAHEFAHRWVHLSGEDLDCEEENVHKCEGWISRDDLLKRAVCRGAWKAEGNCEEIVIP